MIHMVDILLSGKKISKNLLFSLTPLASRQKNKRPTTQGTSHIIKVFNMKNLYYKTLWSNQGAINRMAAEARLELAKPGVKDQYVYQFHHSAIW